MFQTTNSQESQSKPDVNNASRFLVRPTVAEVVSTRFARSLEEACFVQNSRAERQLPSGFNIVYHNTEPQFSFGGWLPSRRLSAATTATLVYNFGSVYFKNDDYSSSTDLTKRQKGMFFGESVTKFVERTHQLALQKLDDVRYLREYIPRVRVTVACGAAYHLLNDGGINAKVGAIQNRHCLGVEPAVPVIFAPAGDVELIAKTLENWMCHGALKLPPFSDRIQGSAQAKEAKESSRIAYFDDIPMMILSRADQKLLQRTEPNVYRIPLLYDFYPDSNLKEALNNILKEKDFYQISR